MAYCNQVDKEYYNILQSSIGSSYILMSEMLETDQR